MKYTKHLSAMASSQGVPNMNPEQFKTLMNIVHLEGRLIQLDTLKKKAVNTPEPHKYDLELFTQDKRLYEITRNVEPTIFVRKLLSEQHRE